MWARAAYDVCEGAGDGDEDEDTYSDEDEDAYNDEDSDAYYDNVDSRWEREMEERARNLGHTEADAEEMLMYYMIKLWDADDAYASRSHCASEVGS